ncbi:MAG: translation elongation factor Ts [Phycisphaerae bacterium]|jgi:elongation factor Ts|nr:translation elongation factor Ts [Phycisphaerae bacterium]MDP7286907.1 translation elongation factor Ts [Phycisphaerae bacterium]
MADITAAMVKALRDETGLGMMECKKALTENGGDVEKAKDALRAKGVATAEKRSARDTKEGVVLIATAEGQATMVEVVCETDFCARNEEFQAMANDVLAIAANGSEGDIAATDEINDRVQTTLAMIGENMSFSRGVKICAETIGTYAHFNGKVGVLVGLDGPLDEETLSGLCMHIAFADPIGITGDDVPEELVAKEKQIALAQAVESGKNEEIAEKMVAGKMRKFIASKALVEQAYVRDDKKQVKDILGDATIKAFARFAIN